MELTGEVLQNNIEVFLLIFVRMTGLFVIAPIFGRRNIPVYLKVGFSFMLALMLASSTTVQSAEFKNIYEFFLLVLKEFLVGVTLGYVSYLIFNSIYVAGQLIDMQVGFGVVNVIDPLSNMQVPITATFYFIFSMLIFLLCNGHHILIRGLFDSFELIPIGKGAFEINLLDDILRIFANVFTVSFKISAPILAAILISDVALGIISKTVPQLNVFMVGMPLKIALGLAVMVLTLPMFIHLIGNLVNVMEGEMYTFMKEMIPK